MFFDLSVFLFIFPPFRWLLIFWLNLLAVRACFFVKNSRHSLAMRRQPQRQHQVQMGSIFFFIFWGVVGGLSFWRERKTTFDLSQAKSVLCPPVLACLCAF